MTDLETVKTLVALGEKALQATLKQDGKQIWDDRDGDMSWMTADMAPLDCDYQPEDEALGAFFVAAANSRPAISALVKEVEQLEAEIERMHEDAAGEDI